MIRLLLPLLLVAGTMTLMHTPPRAAETDDADDPFLWLEDVTGEKPLAWVVERNGESTAELAQTQLFTELNERILKILDSDARIPMIAKHGDWYYNFWRDANNPRGLWRRTTLEEYRKESPAWETVLDVDALGVAEAENWVWKGADFFEPANDRAIISLSRGGADAAVEREFDVTTMSFVEDGFILPEAKAQLSWRGPDSLFVCTDFGPGSLTDSGYPRVVKQWTRGTPLDQAEMVYEGQPDDVRVAAFRDLTPGYERDWIWRGVTFYTNELFLRREGQLIKLDKPDDASASTHREWLYLELRSPWTVAERTYPAGALLACQLEDFLKGDRAFDVLFEPSPTRSLAEFRPTRHHVLLNELDNVRNRLYVLTPGADGWQRQELPGAPRLSSVDVRAVDSDESDAYFMIVADYLTPTSLLYGEIGEGPAEKLKQNPAFFDTTGLEVSQHVVASADGTRVPYFLVSRQDVKLDGTNPTLLYGYGGFEIALTPGYQAGVGSAWLEKGGVYAVANIRGGGEFGPTWHQAALKQNRHKAYEDFIAVAEDLVRRGITSPEHLGAMGGSNGGLLMGNMLTRRPDLFKAIVCQVPLLDMRRFNKLLAGASWMGEYGNPDVPEEWEFIRGFSPYHNLRGETSYPRTLFTTSTRDDRVHPGHARKMVALMQSQGHDVLYYENIEGGHGGAADNKQAAFMSALGYTFLWGELR